jgi:hypothetical protein
VAYRKKSGAINGPSRYGEYRIAHNASDFGYHYGQIFCIFQPDKYSTQYNMITSTTDSASS